MDAFTKKKILNKLFKITAISYDGDNKPFVAAYEGRNLPIFGT